MPTANTQRQQEETLDTSAVRWPDAQDPQSSPQSHALHTRSKMFLRRKFIVNSDLQLKLMFHETGLTLVMLLGLSIGLFLPLIRAIATGASTSGSPAWGHAMTYVHGCFWPMVVGCLILSVIHSVWQSHRIAGPLFRVKNHLNRILKGELPALPPTRKGDYLHEEVALLNAATQSLAERFRQLDHASAQATLALEQCEFATENADASATQSALTNAKAKMAAFREALGPFAAEPQG